MATGQGLIQAREQAILNLLLRGTAIAAPTGLHCGLYGAAVIPRSTAVSLNVFYVSATVSNTRLFKVTTAGTTAGTQPAGIDTATDGLAVTDGTATLTDQTMVMDSVADATSVFTSELSGSAYARVNIGQTNFPAASAIGGVVTGSQSQNGTIIQFAAATANWVPIVGAFLATAATAGNYLFWGRFTSQVQINNGQQFQFNANNFTSQVD